jgi:hypothetical protein
VPQSTGTKASPQVPLRTHSVSFSGVGAVTSEGFAPTAETSANQVATFDTAGPMVLEGFAPELLESGSFSVVPGAGTLDVTGHVPDVASGKRIVVGRKQRRILVEQEREEEQEPPKPQETKPPKKARKAGKAPVREAVEPIAKIPAKEENTQQDAQREAERETDLIINTMIKRSEAEELQAIMQILIEEDRIRREKLAQLLRNVEALINPDEDEEALMLLMMAV